MVPCISALGSTHPRRCRRSQRPGHRRFLDQHDREPNASVEAGAHHGTDTVGRITTHEDVAAGSGRPGRAARLGDHRRRALARTGPPRCGAGSRRSPAHPRPWRWSWPAAKRPYAAPAPPARRRWITPLPTEATHAYSREPVNSTRFNPLHGVHGGTAHRLEPPGTAGRAIADGATPQTRLTCPKLDPKPQTALRANQRRRVVSGRPRGQSDCGLQEFIGWPR
jgi:hypothetical protein